jgi:hypothetical protein
MSYFLAGRFHFTRILSAWEQNQVAFNICRRALDNEIVCQLGCNVVQPIVFEIISTKMAADDDLVFFLTGSPMSNTSDELLDYSSKSRSEAIEKIRARAARIKRFLQELNALEVIDYVTLFISEGYDTSYRPELVRLGALTERLLDLAAEYDWQGFPSVVLTIELKASGD